MPESKKIKGKKYDAVALCPEHGYLNEFISWNFDQIRDQCKTIDCIKICSNISSNIHICTCNQGNFIEDIMIKIKKNKRSKILQISGYKKQIGGGICV